MRHKRHGGDLEWQPPPHSTDTAAAAAAAAAATTTAATVPTATTTYATHTTHTTHTIITTHTTVTTIAAQSWLWKRIPRTSDSDKKSFRRMAMTRLVKKQTFQKRWFEFNPAENVISYHKEQPLGEEEHVHVQGTIAISSIVEILTMSPENVKQSIHEREETPTPHVFDIYCVGRVYTMCAPSEEQMGEWVEALSTALAEERRKKKRLNGRCTEYTLTSTTTTRPPTSVAPTTVPTPTTPAHRPLPATHPTRPAAEGGYRNRLEHR